MSAPTDELGRVLRASAADTVERAHLAGPDAATLWGRGRRSAMVSRLAAAGLTGLALLLVAAVALVMRPPVLAPPADGEGPPYPQFVSALFPGRFEAQAAPVFGFVSRQGDGPAGTLVVDRRGLLAAVPGVSGAADGGVLAPDGHHLYTVEGILDLRDDSVVSPMASAEITPWSGVAWSPDSAHVLVDTSDGPNVIDLFANPLWVPEGDDSDVLPAGWANSTTVLGVRGVSTAGRSGVEVVTRGLEDDQWSALSRVDIVDMRGESPYAADASPDGSRMLLRYPAQEDPPNAAATPPDTVMGPDPADRGGWGVLIDVGSAQRVTFPGIEPMSVAGWGPCAPVWQRNEPLTASGGLNRAADGAAVMEFSDRLDVGCVTLAGNELTGTPEQRSAGLVREQVWGVALPAGGGLLVVALVWSAVALRRSRRRGERFLPWILTYPF